MSTLSMSTFIFLFLFYLLLMSLLLYSMVFLFGFSVFSFCNFCMIYNGGVRCIPGVYSTCTITDHYHDSHHCSSPQTLDRSSYLLSSPYTYASILQRTLHMAFTARLFPR